MSQIGVNNWKLWELEDLEDGNVNPDWVDLEKEDSLRSPLDGKDMVNNPQHYTYGGIECIDAMKAMMSREEYIGYLRGAAFKYLWRYPYKGKPKEDLRKAMWYLDKLQREF
jgi:hypothetical protein